MKKLILLIYLFCFPTFFIANNADKNKNTTKTISGKITDVNGETIAGAKIIINETGEIVYADVDGNYKFQLKRDKEYSIQVSTIGFVPLQLKSNQIYIASDLTLTSL